MHVIELVRFTEFSESASPYKEHSIERNYHSERSHIHNELSSVKGETLFNNHIYCSNGQILL